jgi:hypothetical protein
MEHNNSQTDKSRGDVDKQKEEAGALLTKIASLQQQLKLTKENHQAVTAKKESELSALKEVRWC